MATEAAGNRGTGCGFMGVHHGARPARSSRPTQTVGEAGALEPAEKEAALAGVVVDLDEDLPALAFLVLIEGVRPQGITAALPLELCPAS